MGYSHIDRHGREEFGLRETLNELQLDYLDLWLVHWPMGNSTGRNTMDYKTVRFFSLLVPRLTF
jgi:diketogulonate reductase-like aldo/keto reductase